MDKTTFDALPSEGKEAWLRTAFVEEKLTYLEIGGMIKRSRSAVAGFCNRYNIRRPKVYQKAEEKKADTAMRLDPTLPHMPNRIVKIIKTEDRFSKSEIWQPMPGSEPVRLDDAGQSQCRWPVGYRPHMFCGRTVATFPYCAEHYAASVQPIKPKSERGHTGHTAWSKR